MSMTEQNRKYITKEIGKRVNMHADVQALLQEIGT
jgi:hypothetical protein